MGFLNFSKNKLKKARHTGVKLSDPQGPSTACAENL